MQRKTVTVNHQVGLRARIANIFIAKAAEFACSVSIRVGDREINGKSLLGVLNSGIAGGSTIELVTRGSDEEEAMRVLSELIESDFSDY